MNAKVLLAEDDADLAFVIKDNLEEEGCQVVHCVNGEAAIQQFNRTEFDICLLDVMMPLKDGFSIARKIRQKNVWTPILFITARSQELDRLEGFKSGADDYITKPFSMKELQMRMDVFLRRTRKIIADQRMEYQLGTLRFVHGSLKLYRGTETISLTQRESDLLRFLCEHTNRVIRREEILLNVWGKDDYFLGRSMDVFITRLRKYFKNEPMVLLETIHGIGFRLNLQAT
jgi:DNA-binding response OmpR family regulator